MNMITRRFEVYAPVILTTLCRYEHFKRCIDSLCRCTGAEFTDVYLGIDYPSKEEHWDGYRKICEYVNNITGFNNFIVILRDRNYGAEGNMGDLIEQIKKQSDRFILSEDDNEFSPNFLEYMNDGLTRFKDTPNVIRICGCLMPYGVNYNGVMRNYKYNAFPAMDYNASGVGCWTDKVLYDPFTKDSVLKSWKLTYRAFKKGYNTAISRMLHQLKKESQLPDVCLRLFCAFNDYYCIFPAISKVKNWGYDGTGLNSDNNTHLIDLQVLDTSCECSIDNFDIVDYPEVNSYLKLLYDGGWKSKLKTMLYYLVYRTTRNKELISRLEKIENKMKR